MLSDANLSLWDVCMYGNIYMFSPANLLILPVNVCDALFGRALLWPIWCLTVLSRTICFPCKSTTFASECLRRIFPMQINHFGSCVGDD